MSPAKHTYIPTLQNVSSSDSTSDISDYSKILARVKENKYICPRRQKEVPITSIIPTVVNYREGTQPRPSTENWIKDLLSMPLPTRARPSFTHPVLPTRKLPQASYPHPSEGRQNENHNHRKLTKLITWITTLSNLMKLWAMHVGPPKMDGSWFWQTMVY